MIDGGDLYAFACDPGCALARVPTSAALDRGQWRAWDGARWSSLDAATTLFAGASILRVSFNRRAGAWMAVYSKPVSDDVMFRTAPALTGPWSRGARLFVADHHASDGGWTYDALVQPDYEEDNGRVEYVTHSRPNGTFFGSEFALVRVELW